MMQSEQLYYLLIDVVQDIVEVKYEELNEQECFLFAKHFLIYHNYFQKNILSRKI
jgi:hypothetical protein